jgi:hypothetical protein
MSEFIYILENPSFAGVIKIGMTAREVDVRVKELSSHTGVPTEFTVFRKYAVDDATLAERRIHARLVGYRVSENREFFKISAEDAAMIIEEMLGVDEPKLSDPNREDDLFFAATEITISLGKIWPGVLAGRLKISHEEAVRLVSGLRGRGIVNEQYALCADLWAEHRKRDRAERKKQQEEKAAQMERAKSHYRMMEKVRELVADIIDPETGFPVEVSFQENDGVLGMTVHGSEEAGLEVKKRLSACTDEF